MSDSPEQEQEPATPVAREGEHVPPEFQKTAFHCPRCGVLANQAWDQLWKRDPGGGVAQVPETWMATCTNCFKHSYWVPTEKGPSRMADPITTGGPRPHVEMPPDVRGDYVEAQAIVQLSPRGACALLRLATQKLANDLVQGDATLDKKIGTLVSQGLPAEVAQALDVLRVVGNNAVHPGEMVLDDDADTATSLFECLNLIVEDRIARPRRIGGLFGKLPSGAREAIARRDSTSGAS